MRNLLWIILMMAVACACKTQRQVEYVPIESVEKTFEIDSLNRLIRCLMEHNTSTKESEKVSIKETNTYTLNDKGDTIKIIIEKEKDSTKEIQTLEQYYLGIIDSISKTKVRVDSIDRPVPYPVAEYVEVNVLRWWQKALMWAGVVGVTAALGFTAYGVWRLRRGK